MRKNVLGVSSWPSDAIFVFKFFLIYQLLILGLGFVLVRVFSDLPISFFDRLFHWDAQHILRTAEFWYEPDHSDHYRVFPLMPLLIRFVSKLVHNIELAGLVASQICCYFSFLFIYRIALHRSTARVAFISLVLFAFYPTAYFLSIPYMESLFCALTFGTIYFIDTKKYFLAALFALLASITRIPGLFILGVAICFFILEWINYRQWRLKELISIGISSVIGFFIIIFLFHYYYDDYFFFLHERRKFWGPELSSPMGALSIVRAQWDSYSLDQKFTIGIFPFLTTLGSVILGLFIWKKLKNIDRAFLAVHLVVMLSIGFWVSHPRLLLPLYPIYIGLAHLVEAKKWIIGLALFVSGLLFFTCWTLFLLGNWAF